MILLAFALNRGLSPSVRKRLRLTAPKIFFSSISPIMKWVGTAYWPFVATKASAISSSIRSQSVHWARKTNAWCISMIWSNRARNMSLRPVALLFRGRMICLLNHRQKRSIENNGCGYQSSLKCRKNPQQKPGPRPISYGFGYSQTPENKIISKNCEFLTDDGNRKTSL